MKILIIGGSSIVGFKMLEFLREKKVNVDYTYYSNNINIENGHYLDIRNKDDVLKLIRKIKPTVVFHTSALMMDECELDHDLADSINVQGVSNIISACKETTSKIVYVSTSVVFNGDKSEYFETDNVTPTTYYGITKGKAENLIKKSGLNYLILRTDALYDWTESWHKENSVTRALNTIKAGKSLREVTDWYNTPTYVSDFVSATLRLIEKNKEGIYHLSGSEYINRYDWSLLVAKIFGLEKNIEPINSTELNLQVKRVNINLNNKKLFEELGIRMKNVKDGLQSMLDNKIIIPTKINSQCRFCNFTLKEPCIDLGVTPLSNSYLKFNQVKKPEKKYPLQVFVCEKCFLVQLKEYVSNEEIFHDYSYLSSYSKSWLDHAKNYVNMVTKRFNLNKKSLVIEIASNDGYLLQYFLQKKIPVIGIEPSSNIVKISRRKGISTIADFFGEKLAKSMTSKSTFADLIIANNVFAHDPDIHDFVKGIKLILKPTGIATIEVPSLLKLIEKNEFDTIYHEHFSYFSLDILKKIFSDHNLSIFDIDELPTHGGSLRIYVKHKNNKQFVINSKINYLIKKENKEGLHKLKTFYSFNRKIKNIKTELNEFLKKTKNSKKTIVCYGAPAKGNTLLNYCNITSNDIPYTVDKNPIKQNLFLPGSHIPIKHPNEIIKTKPDYLLILPWNLSEEIMEEMSFIRKWNGKFVIPIPNLKIL